MIGVSTLLLAFLTLLIAYPLMALVGHPLPQSLVVLGALAGLGSTASPKPWPVSPAVRGRINWVGMVPLFLAIWFDDSFQAALADSRALQLTYGACCLGLEAFLVVATWLSIRPVRRTRQNPTAG